MFHQLLTVHVITLAQIVFSQTTEVVDPTCQAHFTHGYGYRLFFHLPSSAFQKDGSILFKFALSARSNGHILLSEDHSQVPGYEVVIGAGGNIFSEIRKYQIGNHFESKASIVTRKILSATEFRNFSIGIKKSEITVSTKNGSAPWNLLLAWVDKNPLDVKFLSFSGWTGVTVKWLYDCKGATAVVKDFSVSQKLKKQVLNGYDPYALPVTNNEKLSIDTTIRLHYINLAWSDSTIRWKPEEFNNISDFHVRHNEIWLPEFVLYNSLDHGSSPMEKAIVRVTSEGNITWSPEAKLVTLCNIDLKQWPFGQQMCNISLGLYSYQESVHVLLSSHHWMDLELKNLEWKIMSVIGETTIIVNPWEYNNTLSYNKKPTAFQLSVYLKRQTQLYLYSFIIPIIVTIFLMFASFWMPIISSERLFLHSSCLALLLINLLAVEEALPGLPTSTPFLLIVSSNLFFLSSIHVIFTTVVMSLTKLYVSHTPKLIVRIVNHPLVNSYFCLYGEGQFRNMQDENLINTEENRINTFIIFCILLDRILFVVSMLFISFSLII